MKPLNRDEFAAALKKGLGRAWLQVANYGLDDVADLVLEACLHNQQFDPLCESTRAPWLFEMFDNTSHYSRFCDVILSELHTENCTWYMNQVCRLAKEMAAHGDEAARQALRDYTFYRASQSDEDDWRGTDAWIELTGAEGVIELSRIYGQRLLVEPSDNPHQHLFWLDIWEDEIVQSYQADLLQLVPSDPAIKAYYAYLEAAGTFTPRQPVNRETAAQQRRQRAREEYPLDRILADARNGVGKYLTHYSTFGHYATPEELETVYNALLIVTNNLTRVRLLWVFHQRPLPRLADMFFDWAMSGDEDLCKATLSTLKQVSDDRVHALARSKVMSGHLYGADSYALALFLNNYHAEDAALINVALVTAKLETDEDAHNLGSSLVILAGQHDDPKLTPALHWVYENTPCAFCRHSAVDLLDQFHSLDDALLQECLHDAEEDTRELAQKQLGL